MGASMCSYPSLPDDSSLEAWDCGGPCDAVPGMTNVFTVNNTAKDAFVYGGKLNGECTLTFRGTSNTAGWMQDLKSATLVDLKGCSANGKTCKVGSGFLDNYNSLSAAMKSKFTSIGCTKDTPIAFVGHSLGAAEATVAMFSMHLEGYQISKSYTFGQPRVGDPTFKQAYESTFKNTPTFPSPTLKIRSLKFHSQARVLSMCHKKFTMRLALTKDSGHAMAVVRIPSVLHRMPRISSQLG